MYIHDVIGSLRQQLLEINEKIHTLRFNVKLMEVYLSQVSDYPAPGSVSRETEAHDGDTTTVSS